MTKETAYFCPTCGSPSLEMSVLVGGNAKCTSCGWAGPSSGLLAHSFEHDLGDAQQQIEIFVREITNTLVKLVAKDLGKLLAKWGFLDLSHKDAKYHLQAFMIAAGKALAVSFVETRQKIVDGTYSGLKGAEKKDGN